MSRIAKQLTIAEEFDLQAFTTFNVKAKACRFLELSSKSSILDALPEIQQHSQRLVLGGGSNILFVGDYAGLILYPRLYGIELIAETDDEYLVSVGASENWHDWVCHSNQQGWYGLENLALIPGTVGAAPIQNIGAYGVEVKSFIHQVECIDLDSGKVRLFSNKDCQFGYRDSLFKQAGQGKYIVTRVEFKLRKAPELCIAYEPLKTEFSQRNDATPLDLLSRVCELRRMKLPDPDDLPNAGSFFKNPIISEQRFEELKRSYPTIVSFADKNGVKLAAAWLIDQAGFKGLRDGNVGVHQNQALVLVNYGEMDGQKVWQLALKIQAEVKRKYGVTLEPEVRIEGFSS